MGRHRARRPGHRELDRNLTRISAAAPRALRPAEEHKDGDGLGARLHAPVGLRPAPRGWSPRRTTSWIRSHRGIQIVQTQPNCGTPSAAGPLIGPLTGQRDPSVQGHVRRAAARRCPQGPAAGHGQRPAAARGLRGRLRRDAEPEGLRAGRADRPPPGGRLHRPDPRGGRGRGALLGLARIDPGDARYAAGQHPPRSTWPAPSGPTRAPRRGSRRRAAGPVRSRS